MGSRRKSAAPAMGDRLVDAFWTLLQDRRVDRITVKSIVDEAECSRGSFYYYYEDVPALAFSAIKDEILLSEGIPRVLRALVLNENNLVFDGPSSSPHAVRVRLAAAQGARDVVISALESSIEAVWQDALQPSGKALDPETIFAIRMFSSGLLEAFPLKDEAVSVSSRDPHDRPERARKFLRAVTERARKAEGVSEKDFAAKIEALSSTAIYLRSR